MNAVLLRSKLQLKVQFREDLVFVKLFADVNENFTQLEITFHAFLIILDRQCIDQLPEGKYWLLSDLMRDLSKNVPSTNPSEAAFATLDLLSNASMETLFSLTMWARDHTLVWMSNKNPEGKNEILNLARVKKPDMRGSIRTGQKHRH